MEGLTNGLVYSFQVVAVNAFGNSARSLPSNKVGGGDGTEGRVGGGGAGTIWSRTGREDRSGALKHLIGDTFRVVVPVNGPEVFFFPNVKGVGLGRVGLSHGGNARRGERGEGVCVPFSVRCGSHVCGRHARFADPVVPLDPPPKIKNTIVWGGSPHYLFACCLLPGAYYCCTAPFCFLFVRVFPPS